MVGPNILIMVVIRRMLGVPAMKDTELYTRLLGFIVPGMFRKCGSATRLSALMCMCHEPGIQPAAAVAPFMIILQSVNGSICTRATCRPISTRGFRG